MPRCLYAFHKDSPFLHVFMQDLAGSRKHFATKEKWQERPFSWCTGPTSRMLLQIATHLSCGQQEIIAQLSHSIDNFALATICLIRLVAGHIQFSTPRLQHSTDRSIPLPLLSRNHIQRTDADDRLLQCKGQSFRCGNGYTQTIK